MAYEKPTVVRLGSLSEMTLSGCIWGKTWGGSDFIGQIVGTQIGNCGS